MTEPLDLEPIKARLDSAPRAPWVGEREGNTDTWRFWFGFVDGEATAELIAYAPTDLAALVAEVERLRAVATWLAKERIDEHGRHDLSRSDDENVADLVNGTSGGLLP